MSQDIRKEFEEAFTQYCGKTERPEKSFHRSTALWAAKWMATKCIELQEIIDPRASIQERQDKIRQLAKGLNHE